MREYFRRNRIMAAILSVFLCGMLLCGCGEQFPTLTQEEYDLIVDYSAGVLAKYSTNCGDKLTRVPPQDETADEQTEEPAEEKPEDKKPEKPAAPAKNETPDPAEEDAGDGKPTGDADAPEESGNGEPAQESGEEPVSEGNDEGIPEMDGDDLFQRLQDGIKIDYNGYYVLNKYPDNVTGSGTALRAEPGNKLLILSFDLTNTKGESVNADILAADPTFTLMIDSQPVSMNLVTLLDNELSTYSATLESGETRGVVLCFNITEEQAGQLETVVLRINCRGEEQIVRLQ